MSFINAIGTAVPVNRFAQNDLCAFMTNAMQPDQSNQRRLKAIFKSSGIDYRHSVLDDYGKSDAFEFYPNTSDFEPFPSTEARLAVYQKNALALSEAAIQNCVSVDFDFKKVTHLIVVSCTGMYAPGLDIDLVAKLKLNSEVQRTCINFMGCYAAFNAIKIADSFCKTQPDATVLIVCVELCSIHFQKEASQDNMLANALFGDGAAAILMQPQSSANVSFEAIAFHNALHITENNHMAWSVGNLGFEMKLSSYVPDIIRGGILKLTSSLLEKIKKDISDVEYFVIHPGGKKILEAIEDALELSDEQTKNSYNVLRKYGNMSSPTVLFVLQELAQSLKPKDNNKLALSFAFGPGLTLESMLLQIHS